MIEGLELLDKELAKDVVTDKTGILDVKIRLNNGTTIDLVITGYQACRGVTTYIAAVKYAMLRGW